MSTIKIPTELTKPVVEWVNKLSNRKKYLDFVQGIAGCCVWS